MKLLFFTMVAAAAVARADLPLQLYSDDLTLSPGQQTTLRMRGGVAPYRFMLDPPAPAGGEVRYQEGNTAIYLAPAEAPYPQRPDNLGRLAGSVSIDVTDSSGQETISAVEILAR